MKKRIITILCSIGILIFSIPVYADRSDPFKGWNDENKKNAWSVISVTDWSKLQDFLTLKNIESTVSANVSGVVRGYETEVRRIINETHNISISDGLVELMLAIMQVMGGNYPPIDDPYNVKVYIDPSNTNITYEQSIQKVLFRLEAARKAHPEKDKVSYFQNSEELKAVIQGVILGTDYVQENSKYSVESANAFYEAHKSKYDKMGVTPKPSLADEVGAIFKTTNAFGAVGSAEGKEVVEYARQFIGNPYVYGGNSLTNGIDCSGFTQQIYGHFGYKLPRTTGEQIHCGIGISYNEHQAGDLIFYPGHVAILVGDGGIIHASNSKPYPKGGIKYTPNALYRNYLSVRRILQ